MQLVDDRLILSASDLINHLECAHLTSLDLGVRRGALTLEETRTDAADLVARKGDEFELAYLESLRAAGREVVEIVSEPGLEGLGRGAERTLDAMRSGAEVIYQAVLFDGERWRGYADFLERVDSPSELGEWSYEVADTKLARRVKPYFLLQLCFYSELLTSAQGVAPEWMHVVLGSRTRESLRLPEFTAYYRRVKARFEQVLEVGGGGTYPDPVEHCGLCRWQGVCDARRETDDHLSLVANMRRVQTLRLNEVGLATVAQLGAALPAQRPVRIGGHTFEALREQARLQVEQRTTGEPRYELLAPEEGRGFARLPQPSEGDLFFDMEGDPFFEDGLEYLFGVTWMEAGEPRFRAFWATSRAEEKRAFEDFIDFVMDRLDRFPDLHVYHYAPYEPTALKRLMGLHATREDEIDHLLRNEVLVDLYAVVRQALRISQPSYSIKKVEAFYMEERDTEVAEGGDSIIAFEEFLETGDRALLEAIERYNDDDCRSTWLLRDWLLERRAEAIENSGQGIPWMPAPEPWQPDPEDAAALDELRGALIAGAPEEPAERDGDEHARWLLGQLLDYHRREAKPEWWAYFERLDADEQQLVELDTEALGGLTDAGIAPRPLPPPARSAIYTLRSPAQEHKIGPGDHVDPATEKGVNVVRVDDAAGIVEIRRATARADEPLPRTLIPGTPYNTRVQRAALRRLASDVLDRGLEAGGRYTALRAIVRRDAPRSTARPAGGALQHGAFELEEAKALAAGLDDSSLFIQGPPGSGKTFTGAHLICHLLSKGARVGVASSSHAAIHNLLSEVERFAGENPGWRGMKKHSGTPESRFRSAREQPLIDNSDDVGEFAAGDCRLVAGTAWLFARAELDSTLDYLFVDEAGQISLADALAIGTSARNLVLLGDPLQLAQVSQAVHPPGAGASVLEHLLGEHATIPPDRGLFIDETRRMHPDVCRFISEAIYEGRLESFVDCARQRLHARGELTGTGVRYVPVVHDGNARQSAEEAREVARCVDGLIGADYTTADGDIRPLRPDDIMVVAPYNAQVRCLREHLPDGVRVGTVDKFQGQEAAVAFFSMATSSGAELPRNLEFLFSRNRLNVAVSRARCLAVLVCSPELLHVRCRSAEQMRLVNALCLLVEMAAEQDARIAR
ncbi:MAG: TM0106 family RecB-like putative nuclease [Thermoleophilaceae bacterium]